MTGNQESLARWQMLRDYIACMESTVGTWESFFDGFHPQRFSQEDITAWLIRIRHSLRILERKYAFNTLEKLSVESSASGFPQRYHMRLLGHEYANLMALEEPPRLMIKELKRAFLDGVLLREEVNVTLLEKISDLVSQELLLRAEPLHLFKVQNLSEVAAENGHRAYSCCWERYDTRSIPSLYVMLFEYGSDGELTPDEVSELAFVLREETSQRPLLEQLGRNIDYAMAFVHPQWIGRISLGPVFISHLTQDNNPLQKVLERVAEEGDGYQSASRIIYEHVIAERAVPVESLFDPNGRKHDVIQEFAVRRTDDECDRRRVSEVNKFLFAPHTVTQLLSEDFRNEIGHELIGE